MGLSGRLHHRSSTLVLVADARLDDRDRLGRELGLSERDLRARDDAAVIARAYERWGEGCAGRLVGAFAFVLWDAGRELLLAARDHMGFRPLHWFAGEGGIVLASWAEGVLLDPAVPRRVDPAAVEADWVGASQLLRERSLFAGVEKLAAGGVLVARPGRVPSLERHWRPRRQPDAGSGDPEECVAAVREAVREAVADAVRDAEPIAAHLSGGLDSSVIAVLADEELRRRDRRLSRCYSWSPPPTAADAELVDERARVERIAASIGAPLTYLPMGLDDVARMAALRAAAQPTAMQAPEHPVLLDAAGRGLRVLLSGWGGDEVVSFNGRGLHAGLIRSGRPQAAVGEAWSLTRAHGSVGPRRLKRVAGLLWNDGVVPLIPDRAWAGLGFDRRRPRGATPPRLSPGEESARRASALSTRTRAGVHSSQIAQIEHGHLTHRIESWAWTGDRVGVTYRYPLLDRRVVDLCLSLPEGLWWRDGERRWIFRRVAEGILPPGLLSQPLKEEPALTEVRRELRDRWRTRDAP